MLKMLSPTSDIHSIATRAVEALEKIADNLQYQTDRQKRLDAEDEKAKARTAALARQVKDRLDNRTGT